MKDFFGQSIEVGDLVYCVQSNSTGSLRTIKKFSIDGTRALCTRDSYYYHYTPTTQYGQGYTEKRSKKDSKWFDLTQIIKAPDGFKNE